jgi:membrane-associated phospholipid phosphatase
MKLRFSLLFAFLLLFNMDGLNAQAEDFYPRYLISYPQTAFTAYEAPLKWEFVDWLKAGGVVAIGGSLYFLDKDINTIVQRNRSPLTHKVARAGDLIGNGRYTITLIGVTWLGGYAFKSDKTQDTALLCTKSLLFGNGLTTVLKYATQRYRPNLDKGNAFWSSRHFTLHKDSFPSGHTTLVWSIAPVIAEQYKETVWVPPLAYGIACVTGYSRLHDEKHWSSDVFAGAVIGYCASQLALDTTPRLSVAPSVEPVGIQIGWLF